MREREKDRGAQRYIFNNNNDDNNKNEILTIFIIIYHPKEFFLLLRSQKISNPHWSGCYSYSRSQPKIDLEKFVKERFYWLLLLKKVLMLFFYVMLCYVMLHHWNDSSSTINEREAYLLVALSYFLSLVLYIVSSEDIIIIQIKSLSLKSLFFSISRS